MCPYRNRPQHINRPQYDAHCRETVCQVAPGHVRVLAAAEAIARRAYHERLTRGWGAIAVTPAATAMWPRSNRNDLVSLEPPCGLGLRRRALHHRHHRQRYIVSPDL